MKDEADSEEQFYENEVLSEERCQQTHHIVENVVVVGKIATEGNGRSTHATEQHRGDNLVQCQSVDEMIVQSQIEH